MGESTVATQVGQVFYDIVAAVADGSRAVPEIPTEIIGPRHAQITLRANGKKINTQWLEGSVPELLAEAVAEAVRKLPRRGDNALSTVEITLPTGWTKLTNDDLSPARSNDFRSRYGIELRNGHQIVRMGAMEQISRNLRPERCVELLTRLLKTAPFPIDTWKFTADEYLIDLKQQQWFPTSRGQTLVPQSDITEKTVREMADSMTSWLVRQVGPKGKMTYKFFPANGSYSKANNPMRQFLASATLATVERRSSSSKLHTAVQRNFKHNFNTYYRTDGDLGFIDDGGDIKLGASAAAMLAILSLPDPMPWQSQLQRLGAFVEAMQNDDGSFRTFHNHPKRTEGQDTYPGQALLALARLHERNPDEALLDRLKAGFKYYSEWYRRHPSPQLVAWHTQAYCLLHRFTGEQAVAECVFEMNDWVLGLQETADCPPDAVGGFLDRHNLHSGPSDAATTGLLVTGLINAMQLAQDVADSARADAYRGAVVSGLRALRQLQFRTDTDMYYFRQRDRVQGALRTTLYDNTVRIDNTYQALEATLAVPENFNFENLSSDILPSTQV